MWVWFFAGDLLNLVQVVCSIASLQHNNRLTNLPRIELQRFRQASEIGLNMA
jgi:hypothetical protein